MGSDLSKGKRRSARRSANPAVRRRNGHLKAAKSRRVAILPTRGVTFVGQRVTAAGSRLPGTTSRSGARSTASGNGLSTWGCSRRPKRNRAARRRFARYRTADGRSLGADFAYAVSMLWQSLNTVALDVDSGIAPARARAITEALCRRIIALLVNRSGRY